MTENHAVNETMTKILSQFKKFLIKACLPDNLQFESCKRQLKGEKNISKVITSHSFNQKKRHGTS